MKNKPKTIKLVLELDYDQMTALEAALDYQHHSLSHALVQMRELVKNGGGGAGTKDYIKDLMLSKRAAYSVMRMIPRWRSVIQKGEL